MLQKISLCIIGFVICVSIAVGPDEVLAGDEAYYGEISWFAGNYAPQNWAFCDGQLLRIADYTPLFALISTYYGGDGVNTFALPDMRGRVPMHKGTGPGLTPRYLGDKGGYENVTPTITNTVRVEPAEEESQTAVSVIRGDSQLTHNNMQPYLGINCIIALQGLWPPRP
jgi:microcystin-dependent protein